MVSLWLQPSTRRRVVNSAYNIVYYTVFQCQSSLLESVKSGKSRDRSRDVVGGDESHDTNHSKTSVVQFTVFLCLQYIGINSREVELREDNFRGGSSLHVVGSLGFTGKFTNEDHTQNLSLSGIRDGIPGIEGLHGGKRSEVDIRAELTREMVSSGLDDVSGEGKHGNTSVLEFGGTEPSKGLITSDRGEAKRIEVLDWLGASGHGVKVSTKGSAGSLSRGRGEGSGGTGKGEESEGLHGV
mmetsp:Transcript_22230/g.55042  ORF Transcript_22230/g.55042 Transcript_22230/m.55042 type:complete len:241 (+) Transcript_22230:134-856(+)